jgi:hypothetical protein
MVPPQSNSMQGSGTLDSHCAPLAMAISTHAWQEATIAICVQNFLILYQCFDIPFLEVSCPLLHHACAIPILIALRNFCKDILYQPHA